MASRKKHNGKHVVDTRVFIEVWQTSSSTSEVIRRLEEIYPDGIYNPRPGSRWGSTAALIRRAKFTYVSTKAQNLRKPIAKGGKNIPLKHLRQYAEGPRGRWDELRAYAESFNVKPDDEEQRSS